ncbi:MAG: response regulator, partial [Solirubrobacteraceae bacterium]
MTLRVLIADDQDLVRDGFRMILTASGIEVVGEARDGREAIYLARRRKPDVVLMDIRMPGVDGLQATRELAGPGVTDPIAVLVLTTFDLDEHVLEALRSGASGFLLKDAGRDQLIEAIHAVARGDALIAPSITRRLIERLVQRSTSPIPPELDELTPRELEVVRAIARGRSNGELAHDLT